MNRPDRSPETRSGPDRFAGYDVLAKRRTPSWNDASRRVIDARLAAPRDPRFCSPREWRALGALCDRITPQPQGRPPVPVAAIVDEKLAADSGDGFRNVKLPPLQAAWRRGLAALDGEALAAHGREFADLSGAEQDRLLRALQAGKTKTQAWGDMPCALFFSDRILPDIVSAYYAHPSAWSEIGFGGPAGPRGYVRMDPDQRDPWEAAERGR